MFCHKCGAKAIDGAEFCQKCGSKIIKNEADNNMTADMQSNTIREQGTAYSAVPASGNSINVNVQNEKPVKKKSKKRFFIIGAIILVIIIIIAASAGNSEMDYIKTVKGYTPFENSQGLPYTCEEVFGKYMKSAVWETSGDGDTRNVTVSGTIKGTDTDIAVTIKASPDPNDSDIAIMSPVSVRIGSDTTTVKGDVGDILYLIFASYDEGLEDLSEFKSEMSDLHVLLKSIAEAKTGSEKMVSTNNEDQILIWDMPLQTIMMMSKDEIIQSFGEPDDNIDNSTIQYGADYPNIVLFAFDNENKVKYIDGNAAQFTYKGQSMSQEEESIAALFGKSYEKREEVPYFHLVTWSWNDYSLMFYFSSGEYNVEDPNARNITVEKMTGSNNVTTDNVPYGYEDDSEFYQTSSVDPALVGRWRASDGGALEINSDGDILSVDFDCWSVRDNKPHYISCYTDNGRIYCTAYFNLEFTYDFGYYQSSDKEYIKFGNGGIYTREEGTTGSGLVGFWSSGLYNNGFRFYEDGTGILNGKYEMNWYTYTADDGKNTLNYTISDQTYFDYYAVGDILTVYLSDGSRTYTKIA